MIARLILGARGLLSAGIAEVKRPVKAIYKWSLGSSVFWGRAETFWNESAVLWFVFPLLDGIYDRARDKPSPTVRSILASWVFAALFFHAAVYSEKRKMKLEQLERLEKGEIADGKR